MPLDFSRCQHESHGNLIVTLGGGQERGLAVSVVSVPVWLRDSKIQHVIVLVVPFPPIPPETTQLLQGQTAICTNGEERPGSGGIMERWHCVLEGFQGSLTL